MTYKVHLIYFRPTGKFLTRAETMIAHEEIAKIWEELHEMRRWGRLPGLRPNAGRDLLVVVDVPDHPQRELHLVMPPLFDEDDVTPSRIAREDSVALEELRRTSTRDVIKVDPTAIPDVATGGADDEITPINVPIPALPHDET